LLSKESKKVPRQYQKTIMEAIYVLSDPDHGFNSKYKVGITTRKKTKLLRDYRRSMPEVIMYLFEQCNNNREFEKEILTHFENCRIKHESGNLSEWVQIDLQVLLKYIRQKLPSYQNFVEDDESKLPLYEIKSFIKDKCYLIVGASDACKNLYDEYLQSAPEKSKMKYMVFCRMLTKELELYYKIPKKDLKYKHGSLIYYKGIMLIKNYKYCVIL